MGRHNLITDPNAINSTQVEGWISRFNSLPGAQVFLSIPGRPGGNIIITDNPASRSLSPTNRAKIATLLNEGIHGLNQQAGGTNVEFLNPTSPDGKDPLNILVHEIGHMKWPGLGNDDHGHHPLFYRLLNDSLEALGLPVNKQFDLHNVNINAVTSPAGSDPLRYNITKSATPPPAPPSLRLPTGPSYSDTMLPRRVPPVRAPLPPGAPIPGAEGPTSFGDPNGGSTPLVPTKPALSPINFVPLPSRGGPSPGPGKVVGFLSGVEATAQHYMNGQLGYPTPPTTEPHGPDQPLQFLQNGTQPVSATVRPNQIWTVDPSANHDPGTAPWPAAFGAPLLRPQPPQAAAASWPSTPVAPLRYLPQAAPAAPERPDLHDAGDWPQQGLPTWAQTKPPTENTFPAFSNGVRDTTASQPLASQPIAPQPAQPVENLTTRTLRMKGVPDAGIAAAIGDKAKMQDLLNQLYGPRSIAPGNDIWAAYDRATQSRSADQPAPAPAPEKYIPFGWAGLPALLR